MGHGKPQPSAIWRRHCGRLLLCGVCGNQRQESRTGSIDGAPRAQSAMTRVQEAAFGGQRVELMTERQAEAPLETPLVCKCVGILTDRIHAPNHLGVSNKCFQPILSREDLFWPSQGPKKPQNWAFWDRNRVKKWIRQIFQKLVLDKTTWDAQRRRGSGPAPNAVRRNVRHCPKFLLAGGPHHQHKSLPVVQR